MSGKQEMTTAPYPHVSNELLSAYIDGAVSEEERRLIESAVAHNPDVAWRLESLRATVQLLRELPALSLPRSFLLTPEQVTQGAPDGEAGVVLPHETRRAQGGFAAPKAQSAGGGGFWQQVWAGWMTFWQGGNGALRNAMAASFALLLMLLLGPRFLTAPPLRPPDALQTVASSPAPRAVSDADMAAAALPSAVDEQPQSTENAGQAEAAITQPAGQNATGAAAKTADGTDTETTGATMAAADDETALAAAPAAAAPAPAAPAAPAAEVEASDALFTTVPAAPDAQAEGVTLAQSAGGGSVLDEMQRQAGGAQNPAPSAAAAPLAAPSAPPLAEAGAVEGAMANQGAPEPGALAAAQPASSAVMDVSVAPAEESVAEESVAEESVAAELLPSPTAAPTNSSVVIALEPAAGDQQGESGGLPATSPALRVESHSWLAPVLQAGAWLAALATLVFGLLWWRSRPS